MNLPRLEINFERIGQNATQLVTQLADRGIAVTAVTKALHGDPQLAETLVAAGVAALGDSRLESIETMRAAGHDCPIYLLRSPAPSQVSRVVASGAISLNSEIEVVELLSAEARRRGVVHSIIVMIELGDLREGVMPEMLYAMLRRLLSFPNVALVGVGANLACRSGIAPDATNMAELSGYVDKIENTFGISVDVISGGNSANLHWALNPGTGDTGRINNLRLGEAILLGRDPLTRIPLEGLNVDAFALVAEVIESIRKPTKPRGRQCETAFGAAVEMPDRGDVWQTVLALGHQDTDPAGLIAPTGVSIIAASSDHLITETVNRTEPGTELRFQPNYSALLRATTCPYVTSELVG